MLIPAINVWVPGLYNSVLRTTAGPDNGSMSEYADRGVAGSVCSRSGPKKATRNKIVYIYGNVGSRYNYETWVLLKIDDFDHNYSSQLRNSSCLGACPDQQESLAHLPSAASESALYQRFSPEMHQHSQILPKRSSAGDQRSSRCPWRARKKSTTTRSDCGSSFPREKTSVDFH